VVLLSCRQGGAGKVAQALIHGARVIAIRGNFDRALEMIHEALPLPGLYLLNSVNPYRLEGQKTIGFEVLDQLGGVPDRIVLPVGNAGNISAVHKGLTELKGPGLHRLAPPDDPASSEFPAPVVRQSGRTSRVIPEPAPETVATAIRIGAPVNGEKALAAIRKTGGTAVSVSECGRSLPCRRALAPARGSGIEPASAASVAGVRRTGEEGIMTGTSGWSAVVTGHLLKIRRPW